MYCESLLVTDWRATLVEGYYNEDVALVKDLMSDKLDTVSPDAELSAVTETFLSNKRRIMPVIEAGTLVGILSRHHLLKALAKGLDD